MSEAHEDLLLSRTRRSEVQDFDATEQLFPRAAASERYIDRPVSSGNIEPALLIPQVIGRQAS